jgi:hypothetical protein
VLFGGQNSSGFLGDTWEWDGKAWAQINPTTSPSARRDHAMAYDSARQRVVLFGGLRISSLADTWEWDGKNWTQIKPTTSPSTRSYHAMVYDSARNRVVLFGGWRGGTGSLGDTWEWDGKNWKQIKPTTSPAAREHHAMAFDSARNRVVLFGGQNSSGFLGDTWEWDGKAWAQINPTTSPSARRDHAMAYDSARQRVVLFGGIGSRYLSDTWEWDGKTWTQIKPTTSPSARRYHAMASDSARQRVVLFGGYSGNTRLGDTWEYYDHTGTFSTFGTGCASTATLPTISGTPPNLGQNFTLEIKGFLPKPQFGQLIFGVSNTKWGLLTLPFSLAVLGMGNCNLLVSPDMSSLIATDAQGSFKTTMKVPSSPSILGAEVYGQTWAPDPKSNYTGVAMTNAFKAVVGF